MGDGVLNHNSERILHMYRVFNKIVLNRLN